MQSFNPPILSSIARARGEVTHRNGAGRCSAAVSKRLDSGCLPIESVDVLGAGVSNQQRRIVGGQACPASPAGGLAKIFQVDHLVQLMVADSNTEYTTRLASRRNAEKIDVVSLARPLRITYTDFR